jgi:phage protein U
MSETMMALGEYRFSIDSAAYQELHKFKLEALFKRLTIPLKE